MQSDSIFVGYGTDEICAAGRILEFDREQLELVRELNEEGVGDTLGVIDGEVVVGGATGELHRLTPNGIESGPTIDKHYLFRTNQYGIVATNLGFHCGTRLDGVTTIRSGGVIEEVEFEYGLEVLGKLGSDFAIFWIDYERLVRYENGAFVHEIPLPSRVETVTGLEIYDDRIFIIGTRDEQTLLFELMGDNDWRFIGEVPSGAEFQIHENWSFLAGRNIYVFETADILD